MIKKIILTLATLFLIWFSTDFLSQIHKLETRSFWILLFISWIVNMIITGIFAFSGFAYPTQKLLPQTYYEIRNGKRLAKWYKALKVEWFRLLLLATFWRNKKQRRQYFNGTRQGFTQLSEQSKKSEFGHLIPFVLLILISLYVFIVHSFLFAMLILAWNILGNFYPILLQRWHRRRLMLIFRRYPPSEIQV